MQRVNRGQCRRDQLVLMFYAWELRKSGCCGCRRCGRRRGNGHRTAGSCKLRAEGREAALGAIVSISRSTNGSCGNPPAVGAGDVGEEWGMVSVQLEVAKREWRGEGPVWAQSHRSHGLPVGPAEIHLLWVQEIWEKKGDGQRTAGSRKTRVEGRVSASSRNSELELATRWKCQIVL
jgi:hypothetical protein